MNQNHRGKIYQLTSTARGLGHTPEAVVTAEEAVHLADTHNDIEMRYFARQCLIEVTGRSGDYDKMLVAFSWCLGQVDKEPEKYNQMEILWKYKWVIEHLVHFPRISRAEINTALDDFQQRCTRAGFNERPALLLHCSTELKMGRLSEAERWHAQWKLTKRDAMADCDACETDTVVKLYAMKGDHEAAIKAASGILSGRKKCGEIPHLTYAALLKSFWLARDPAEAAEIHEKGYRLVSGNRDFIREQSWHVKHLLRANQLDQATTLVRRHLPWALETHNLDYQLYFFIATRSVMHRLAEDGLKSARVRVSEKLVPFAKKTTVPIKPFSEWLTQRIKSLASEFDERNGNTWFTKLAEEAENDK